MPVVKTILVFVLLGPPLGALVYFGGLFAIDPSMRSTLGAGRFFGFVVMFLFPWSYLGIVPALGAGISFALIERIWKRIGLLDAILLGLACGVLFALALDRTPRALPSYPYFAVKVLTCLVPSLICWWLTRPKRANENEKRNEAVEK